MSNAPNFSKSELVELTALKELLAEVDALRADLSKQHRRIVDRAYRRARYHQEKVK
jgi:hypothetical protein